MIQDRICTVCKVTFQGGPRAYYCPPCRSERQKVTNAAYRDRVHKGLNRALGSIDKCERCQSEYTVEGGLQRFCPVCQPIHAAEYDRETALPFYHEHKAQINPVRNERRRVGNRNCDFCGKEYTQTDKSLTCSDECRQNLKNKKWNEKYGPAYRSKKSL